MSKLRIADPARKTKNTFWKIGIGAWIIAFLMGNAGSPNAFWFGLGGLFCFAIAWNIKTTVARGKIYQPTHKYDVKKTGF